MPEPKNYTTSILINASIEKVWEAIISPESTRQYMFGCDAISDWQIGSSLIWKGFEDGVIYVKGEVVKFDPPNHLAFTVIDPNGPYEDIPENYLRGDWVLEEEGEGTRLNITQGDYATVAGGEDRLKDADQGWEFALNGLKKVCES